MMSKKVVLMILDGWGYGTIQQADAIQKAHTPHFDSYINQYPHATLLTSGEHVGLPEGQMGNSEVGHMNIGAGRVVYQELARINKAVKDGELAQNPTLVKALKHAQVSGKALHLMGLVSDGGVHSHLNHLIALCKIAANYGLKKVYIHAFMDGRDTDPKGGIQYIQQLEKAIKASPAQLATLVGRYYAMDRDNRWERVKIAYDLLVHGEGAKAKTATAALQASYNNGITDEFIKPICIEGVNGQIQDGDVVICFNFRTDRAREITQALTQRDIHEYNMHKVNLHYVTMTNYDDSFKGVEVIFTKDDLSMTLGEVLEQHHKKQIRIAETEKYPHVTFFFSGGREQPFRGESRIMIPSPKVATYDLQPEMSAQGITDAICVELRKQEADFVCLNFANPDMVGHTGVFEAVVKAVEKVDTCMAEVVSTGIENGYSFMIIADHGNADFMVNEDGSPNTAHTTNLVPCILIDEAHTHITNGKLGDIAPTLLKLMGLAIPKEMTGNLLI